MDLHEGAHLLPRVQTLLELLTEQVGELHSAPLGDVGEEPVVQTVADGEVVGFVDHFVEEFEHAFAVGVAAEAGHAFHGHVADFGDFVD